MKITNEKVAEFLKEFAEEVYDMPEADLDLHMDDHYCVKWEGKEYFVQKDNSFYTDEDEEILDFLRKVTDVVGQNFECQDCDAEGFVRVHRLQKLADLLWGEDWEDEVDGDNEMIESLLEFIGEKNYIVEVDESKINVIYSDQLETANETANKYELAYNVLMEYFDSIPDENKKEVSDKLEKLGL